MKIILEIKDKKQLDAVYFAYENPTRILNLIEMDITDWNDIPIDNLKLTVRSTNCLKSEGIETVGQLIKCSYWDIYSIPNLGRKSVDEIVEVLMQKGLFLKEKNEQH
jgi:DNA-directed RNA polymerase alpha subunit